MRKLCQMGGGRTIALKSIILAIVFLFASLFGTSSRAAVVADSLRFRVLFPINSYSVLPEFSGNEAVLSDFQQTFDEIGQDRNVKDISITIRGNASIDGEAARNIVLAGDRAKSLAAFISSTYSIPESLITVLPEQPLNVEAKTILETFPETVPGIYVAAIREMTGKADGLKLKRMLRALDGREEGANWNWYVHNVLEPTRFAEIALYFSRITADADTVSVGPAIKVEVAPVDFQGSVLPPSDTLIKTETEPEPEKHGFRIGTNLLYDVATVANIFFEADFAGHMAVNVSATFSPWDIRRPDIKLRTLIFQPEFRWYLAKNFKGHYVGVEGHYGWYNIALGGKTRYQDRDGNTPLWGAGLSYGYVLEINEHLGFDFGISAGYASLVYDCFYNIENGAKYTTQGKDWWGPTKAGVSIYYKF